MLPAKLGDFRFTIGRVTFIQSPRYPSHRMAVDAGQVDLGDCRIIAGAFNHLAELHDAQKGQRAAKGLEVVNAINSLRFLLADTTNEFHRAALVMAIDRMEREAAHHVG